METGMSLKQRWIAPWLASPLLCVAVHAHAQSVKDQCIDANEEAQRQKRAGEFHAARARLDVCRREECPAPVRKDCVELSNAIDAAMPTVIFEARDPQGAPVTAAKVTMDGRPFAARLDGGATAVDPGWHRFEFEAPGLPRASQSVFTEPGEKNHAVRVDLVDKVGPILRTAGLGTAGAGAVAMAVGAYLGFKSKATYNDALTHCPGGPGSCDPDGVQGGISAHDQARSSTFAFVIGTLLVAGGATLYFMAPKMTVSATPTARADGAGLAVSGAW